MSQEVYANNLGNSTILTQASHVTDQYGNAIGRGYTGCQADWAEVFDTRNADDGEALKIFNIQTLLGNYFLPAEGTGRKVAILGNLTWGVGASSFSVDFDWKTGNQITLAAKFVRLQAAFSEIVQAPDKIRIAGLCTPGNSGARSQVTRTFPQLTISGGNVDPDDNQIVIFPIPPMAHALNLFATDSSFYGTDVIQVRFVGGVSSDFSTTTTDLASFVTDGVPFAQALTQEDGVRYPEAAKFVEVSVAGSPEDVTVFHFTPTFTLNL